MFCLVVRENYGRNVLGCLDLVDEFVFLHDQGLVSCLRKLV